MNSILARRGSLALALAALALSSGCASNRKEGPELNPTVSCELAFAGTGAGRRVALEVEVEQREPYVQRKHSWTVNVWTSTSGSDEITAEQVDAMMSEPPFASMPDLNARKMEAELNKLELDMPRGGYYVVVVAAIEKTKGQYPAVHAVKTFAAAFKNGGERREMRIPAFPPVVEETPQEAAPAEAKPAAE